MDVDEGVGGAEGRGGGVVEVEGVEEGVRGVGNGEARGVGWILGFWCRGHIRCYLSDWYWWMDEANSAHTEDLLGNPSMCTRPYIQCTTS